MMSFNIVLNIMWENIQKGQGGTVNQTNPPKCGSDLAFSKIDFFFVCLFWYELSKSLAK